MGMIMAAPLTIGRVLDVWRDGRSGQSVKLDQPGQTPVKMHTSWLWGDPCYNEEEELQD